MTAPPDPLPGQSPHSTAAQRDELGWLCTRLDVHPEAMATPPVDLKATLSATVNADDADTLGRIAAFYGTSSASLLRLIVKQFVVEEDVEGASLLSLPDAAVRRSPDC